MLLFRLIMREIKYTSPKTRASPTTPPTAVGGANINQKSSPCGFQHAYNHLPPPTIAPIGVFSLDSPPVAGTAVAEAAAVDDSTEVVETMAVPLISSS